MNDIPGVPPVLKGLDSQSDSQLAYQANTTSKPILKRFKISDIPKYDGMTNLHEHIIAFTIIFKGNDLTKDEVESVLVEKFGETLSVGYLCVEEALKLTKYCFTIVLTQLIYSLRKIKEAQVLKPIRSDPNSRDHNLWCDYHESHGHRYGDRRHL
ncbi:hypothetical protein HAX54_045979 [Datura stramonium]|uniref:Uncharacterized protein n=1 Tax=Datura stramonium TaxID=4076 RepID=A0ABS8RPL7_DATST|nr:hypothetical protein [Datura stramonium]